MERAPTLSRTVLELALLELCRDEQTVPLAQLVQRLAALEQRLGAPPVPSAPAASASAPAAAASSATTRPARHVSVEPQVLRPAPPPAPYSTGGSARGSGEKDAFTRSVAELFGGRIEEKS
jgi:hypothetical protein